MRGEEGRGEGRGGEGRGGKGEGRGGGGEAGNKDRVTTSSESSLGRDMGTRYTLFV